jgi:hypothetical protein
VRLGAPIHLRRDERAATPAGLHLAPRDALPQVSAGSEWVHATLALPDGETPARRASHLRSLFVSVITERDQVPSVARVVADDALLGEPVLRDGAWVLDLSFDLADLVALPSEPYHLHLAAGPRCSAVQRREPSAPGAAPQDPAALPSGLDRLVVAYSLSRAGDAFGAARFFAAAFEAPEVRAEPGRPHAFNTACASARVAALHDRRPDLVEYALAWLDEDLRLSEQHLLAVSRALAFAPSGPERQRLQRRRDALVAHLDARATDPDLDPLRDTDAWRSRGPGA